MKSILFLALLGLTACGPGSADTPAAASNTATSAAPGPASDPRIDQIRALHQQILAQQKPLEETEKDPVMLRYGHLKERQQAYKELLDGSQANLATIDQLDPAKSQDATQAALVAESLRKEQAFSAEAVRLVAVNQKFIDSSRKSDKTLDRIKNDPKNKALNLR